MILLVHHKETVIEIIDLETDQKLANDNNTPIQSLIDLASNYSDRILIWCHKYQKNNLNLERIKNSLYLKNMMLSFSKDHYLPFQIGYVEDSPFLNINKKVKYPTWLMSDQVGAIFALQLLKFKDIISTKTSFEYALNSIAKLGMPNGLFCYSDPNLLLDKNQKIEQKKASLTLLFQFVKQHYRSHWIILLILNLIFYEKRFPIGAAIRSLWHKKRILLQTFEVERFESNEETIESTIDVIIPTIGRKKYLFDVLKDLARQSQLPKNVIIVEQNPNINSVSELDYLTTNKWPFEIIHTFIHQTGACNARNIALKKVDSSFVFFADDDIRIEKGFLECCLEKIKQFGSDAFTLSCLQKNEVETVKNIIQWSSFGSGCSIVKADIAKKTNFNLAFEHGFGEDKDYGMKLRNKGIDVLYNPDAKLLHLKATVGGFRNSTEKIWDLDKIKTKPSPTVMLNRITNNTWHQLRGYKTILFFKYYKNQKIRNPIQYFNKFKKEWRQSIFWANILKEQHKT